VLFEQGSKPVNDAQVGAAGLSLVDERGDKH
jgi:hypothetical protein